MKKLFDRQLRIKVFGAGWWFYIVMTIFLQILLTIVCRCYDMESRRKIVFVLSIIELIVLRLYKFSLKDIRDDYNYYNELPCYLCNQSTLLCIAAAYTNNQILMGFCVTAGTLGALLAILMPDRYNRDQLLFSKQALGFYGYHGLLIITCLSFYFFGLYKPRLIDALWVMWIIFFLACIAHIINIIFRRTGLNPISNYVFTYDPVNEALDKLYRLIPCRLLYLIPVLIALTAVSFVMLVIMKMFVF